MCGWAKDLNPESRMCSSGSVEAPKAVPVLLVRIRIEAAADLPGISRIDCRAAAVEFRQAIIVNPYIPIVYTHYILRDAR